MMQRVLVALAVLVLSACASMTDLSTLAEWRAKADKAYQEGQYPTALRCGIKSCIVGSGNLVSLRKYACAYGSNR